jgi:hypothetical protein
MTTKSVLFALLSILFISSHVRMSEASAKVPEARIRVCGTNTSQIYIVPRERQATREILEFGFSTPIVVEPSILVGAKNDAFDSRLDYRITLEGHHYQISEFGTTSEDRDEFAYRRLESTAIACLSESDSVVYLSFSVNGSMRDFIYIAVLIEGTSLHPIFLGHSGYGVLALERDDLSHFFLWDSTEATDANGMGSKHIYQVLSYQWMIDKQSIKLIGQHISKPAYPGQIMGHGQESIKIGTRRDNGLNSDR